MDAPSKEAEGARRTVADRFGAGCVGGCGLQLMLLFGVGLVLERFLRGPWGFWIAALLAAAVPLVMMRVVFSGATKDDWVANVLVPLWAVATMVGIPFLWYLSRQ